MINTHKNMYFSATALTIYVGLIYFVLWYSLYPVIPILFFILLVVLGLFSGLYLMQKIGKRSILLQLIDLRKNHRPLDMRHNDEREWRLMLTASYISQRITLGYLAVLLLVATYLAQNTRPTIAILWLFLVGAVGVGILVEEWSYLIAYFKLDR